MIFSFKPIADPFATCLILGSMPGKISLKQGEYYAHPQNLFWKFLASITGVESKANYNLRCQALIKKKIAVWDVLKACIRKSSLDSDILESSIMPNDFEFFFKSHSQIKKIFFNGAKAEAIYKRHVLSELSKQFSKIQLQRLPSTSPANASIPYLVKEKSWQLIKGGL